MDRFELAKNNKHLSLTSHIPSYLILIPMRLYPFTLELGDTRIIEACPRFPGRATTICIHKNLFYRHTPLRASEIHYSFNIIGKFYSSRIAFGQIFGKDDPINELSS